MKILIVNNAFITTRNNRFYTNSLNGQFAEELIKYDNEVSYFQFACKNNNNISTYDLENNGITCIPLRNYKNKIFKYIIGYIRLFFQIRKYDFIYFYYPTSFKYGTLFCLLFRKKYGLYIRGMLGINDKLSHFIYNRAYTIFTVSDYFTKYVNCINIKKIAHTIKPMIPYSDKDIIFDRKYISKSTYNILFLGRIDIDKGITELFHAIYILNKKHQYNFQLKLVGDGAFLPESKSLASKLKIENIIKFEGAVYNDELKKTHYTDTDIYILPTYHEGFPRTLYEAMIFGTPIITTFVGGISALMNDRFNCIEIKPKSVESIVNKLIDAMENYEKIGEYAKNATKTVAKIVDSQRLTHAQHLNQVINEDIK